MAKPTEGTGAGSESTGGIAKTQVDPRSARPIDQSFDTNDFLAHWQSNYSGLGNASYEDYQPAYRYGAGLKQDERFTGRKWADIEADVKHDWQARYPGSQWEQFKDSVRFGWNKAQGVKHTE